MASVESLAKSFRDNILASGYVLDPEGVHHEFVSGMHGRKLDFDLIETESPLFDQWVEVAAAKIESLYGEEDLGRIVLLSVANGTNRLVKPVAETLGSNYLSALTEKVTPKAVKLTDAAELLLRKAKPGLVVAIEDVGTRGTTTATAITATRQVGVPRVEAVTTWQRRPQLEELVAIDAVYDSIIHEDLPTYTPEECREIGYHALGWEYIPHPVEIT